MLGGEKKKKMSKNDKFTLISNEEKERVIEEIAERMKDMVYTNARKHSERILGEIGAFMDYETNEPIIVTYNVNFCAGDLQQIVARVRREKETSRL